MLHRFVKINNFQMFIALFLFAFFVPLGPFVINGGLIFFIGLFFLLQKKSYFSFTPLEKKYYAYYVNMWFFFFFHIALSINIGALFGNVEIIERDIFEFHRPILYLFLFTFSFLVFINTHSLKHLHILLIVIFVGIITVGLLQFFRVDDNLMELYTKAHNIKTLRIAAPFVNPYDFAFVMTFFIYYFFIAMLYRSWMYIFLFLIALIMFVLPQSRSVAVGFLVSFFVVTPLVLMRLGLNLRKGKVTRPYFYYLVVFVTVLFSFLAAIPYLLENFGYLTGQLEKVVEGGDIGDSAGTRVNQFLFALEKATNPLILLFGNGPSKFEMEYVESMYTYQFYRYGLVGMFLYFVYPLSLTLMLSWRLLKIVDKNSFAYILFLTITLWLLAHPFMFIGNNFTEQIRTSFFYYSLLGIVASQYIYYKQRIKF